MKQVLNSVKNNIEERLSKDNIRIATNNLKKNWFLPISAMAYFGLGFGMVMTKVYFFSLIVAFIFQVYIAASTPPITDLIKKHSLSFKLIAFLSALGVCSCFPKILFPQLAASSKLSTLEDIFPIIEILATICAVISLPFCFCYILLVLTYVVKIIKETKIFKNIKSYELVLYIILFCISFSTVAFVFFKTEAFYGADLGYDVIYSSDSPTLVRDGIYINLLHTENDLRQPLFAVFASPFSGIPYLIATVFNLSATATAVLLNFSQIALLFIANFVLTRLMKLNAVSRVCFMLVSCGTYTYMLFSLMMEQYIIAYFWLVLCIYLLCERKEKSTFAFFGATGTLTTSAALLPFLSEETYSHNFKKWLFDTIEYALRFVMLMLAFCRFDIIINLYSRITFLIGFAGHRVSWSSKIYQYTNFIHDCFLSLNADVNFVAEEHVSWQMNEPDSINIIGVIILALVALSAFLNRNKKSSRIAAYWCVFSFIMLFVLGWGTAENGLILYALYFGWAFMMLLFQLVEWIENRIKVNFIIPIFSAVCVIVLLFFNIPAITELVNFAISYYPV